MSISFHKAKREDTKLLLAMAGPSGSGKTFSALRVATGIVSVTGGKIAFVDTENKRALLNAPSDTEDGFDFEHGNLERPFSSDAYREAIEAAEQVAGENGVVIIDSMSHEHVGPGGYLSWHDEEVERMCERAREKGARYVDPDKYNYPAWAKPSQARARLIDQLLRCSAHLIVCFRAKEKTKLIKNQIVDAGWQPLTGDDFPYDMTTFCLLNPKSKGVPIFDDFEHGKLPDKLAPLVKKGAQLDEAFGKRFAEWAMAANKAPAGTAPSPASTERSEGAAMAQQMGNGYEPPEFAEDDPDKLDLTDEEAVARARQICHQIKNAQTSDKISDLDAMALDLKDRIPADNYTAMVNLLQKRASQIHEAEKAA
ncbi:MAG: hypothetical protein ACR2P3_10080 [Geminicoccaceae bacterium]